MRIVKATPFECTLFIIALIIHIFKYKILCKYYAIRKNECLINETVQCYKITIVINSNTWIIT